MRPGGAMRSVVPLVALWLVVVTVAATAGWWLVSRAGEGVTATDGVGAGGPPTAPVSSRTPAPDRTPTRSPTGTPSSTPAPEVVRDSAGGPGGTVTVTCDGPVAALERAVPAQGFVMEVDDRGPDRVRVDFEGDDVRTRVRASCVDGAPAFEVDD